MIPPLKRIALIRMVVVLWSEDDIEALILNYNTLFRAGENLESWEEIENTVIEKVMQLSQPVSLKEEMLGLIKPIGLQIKKWIKCDCNCYLPKKLCWSPFGTVDETETAEILIADNTIDITIRYRVACVFCLKDDIPKLWKQIPEMYRESLYTDEDPINTWQYDLVIIWTHDINRELDMLEDLIVSRCGRLIPPYLYAFQYAADGGNVAATDYFLQKLTSEDRDDFLMRSALYIADRLEYCAVNKVKNGADVPGIPKEFYPEVLRFLLSELDQEQLIEVAKCRPCGVLVCFSDWPFQDCFMSMANNMWNLLPKEDYEIMLLIIVNKVKDGYKDYDYQKLLTEYWLKSPDSYKKYVVGKCGFLLENLFRIKDLTNISTILSNATPDEKVRIIFGYGKDICKDLVYNDEWSLLKFFICQCITSKETMVKFKVEFEGCELRYLSGNECADINCKSYKFIQTLDDLICGTTNENI